MVRMPFAARKRGREDDSKARARARARQDRKATYLRIHGSTDYISTVRRHSQTGDSCTTTF